LGEHSAKIQSNGKGVDEVPQTAQQRINDWCKRMTSLAKRYDYIMKENRKKEKRTSNEKSDS